MTLRLYAHALKAARARQLRGRLAAPVRRRRFPAGSPPPFHPPDGAAELWRSPAFEAAPLAGSGEERLRSFHAHYGEDVLAAARAGDSDRALHAARSWISANPPAPGDAWHPYTSSTRSGNWIAAAALEPSVAEPDVVESLWRQLLYVAGNVEDGVLGNHVIRNARALVLGGAAFGDERLSRRGRDLLRRELPEQVLRDGGHYERSPVYHAIVLRDLLEIDGTVPGLVPGPLLATMRAFAGGLARPDGRPALFNDGGLDQAPALDLPPAGDGLLVYRETGYAVLRTGPLWLAFDCGAPAPPFLPAHAHADALSFQLWWDGVPVVVDPGTYTYEAGAERDWFRGTEAHSTIAVDGLDQFRLWGAFRSGPLPRVELLDARPTRLEARATWGPVRHTRTIQVELPGNVTVTDLVEGDGEHGLVSSLPLGGVSASIAAMGPLAASHEPRWVSERFFERSEGAALVQRGRLRLPATVGWEIRLPS